VRAYQYRSNALECLRFSREVTAPESRAVLIAQQWLALAEQAEKNDKMGVVYEPPIATTP